MKKTAFRTSLISLGIFLFLAIPLQAVTEEGAELQNQLDVIKKELERSLSGSATPSPTPTLSPGPLGCVNLLENIYSIQSEPKKETLILQRYLMDRGYSIGVPAPTGYFGALTKSALAKFQAQYGISPAEGWLGPVTRGKIRDLSCGTGGAAAKPVLIGPTKTGNVSVELKVNEERGAVSIKKGSALRLEWESEGATHCALGAPFNLGVSVDDSERITANSQYYPTSKGIKYSIICLGVDGVATDEVVLDFGSPTPSAPSSPSSQPVSLSLACSRLSVGSPEVNAPQPGYPWGPAYFSGNPRWREIEWRIQNGVSISAQDLAQYYTEYFTAMGLPQHLTGLLRSDGTPFAGPAGLPVPNGATITNPTPGFSSTMDVFEYQPEIGFWGSVTGQTVDAWLSPFSSADRVVCPLQTPLTGSWNDPEPVFTPPASTKFRVGDSVSATSNLNVRSTANGAVIRTVNAGSQGRVIGGPTYAGNFHWWNIDFGNLGSGWSAEDYLAKIVPLPPGGLRITASYGGATAVVTDHAQPSFNIAGALFGHDKQRDLRNQEENPIVITFDATVKNAGFRVLYEAPNESYAVGSDNLLVSGNQIQAEFFSEDGSSLGSQRLQSSNILGASSEATTPQNYLRVDEPIKSIKIYIPREYNSAVFFSSGIVVD